MLILATIALASAIRFDESEPDNDEYESVSRPVKSKQRPKKDFNIHIVKKRGGKVRQIHLYPVKSHYQDERDRGTHTESETHEHVGYTSKQQEANAAESSKVEKMIDVDGNDQDNAGSDHHYEQKQKIRIKHHHHHHHHNHIKTIVKKEPYPVRNIEKKNAYSIYKTAAHLSQ